MFLIFRPNIFFDYRMSHTNDIASYIQNIDYMALLLQDLGNSILAHMLLSKIICSLPPSSNSVTTVWTNVPLELQTIDLLEE